MIQSRRWLLVLACWIVVHVCIVGTTEAATAVEEEDAGRWSFSDLSPCNAVTHLEDPCIQYDILPPTNNLDGDNNTTTTEIITLVQVTDWECEQFRDGPVVAVNFLNAQGGVPIGFHSTMTEENDDAQHYHYHFVQFRLVSVVAGDYVALGHDVYTARHTALLHSMVQDLNAAYIVGTCSKLAAAERAVAYETNTMLLAQVGPPSFYQPPNPWVFGVHVSSDEYTVDATRRLRFWMDDVGRNPATFPVHVVYRSHSEFFRSTCEAAVQNLRQLGFTLHDDEMDDSSVTPNVHMFDPGADDDQDGIVNQQDEEFLYALADRICPADHDDTEYHPALFICTVSEQDMLLARWRQNGCRPSAVWLTASTWAWATTEENKDSVVYFQGAGQWHSALGYSDQYFSSGTELLDYAQARFGYRGGYDMVVSYSIPTLIAEHLKLVYRVQDEPRVLEDLQNPTSREQLRREMVNIKASTLFGPVAFDRNQRNAGREAAASQWLPMSTAGMREDNKTGTTDPMTPLHQALVSPISHAEANAIVPATAALPCPMGTYVDKVKIANEAAILQSRCTSCPADTFQPVASTNTVCMPCPAGSTTEGEVGADACIIYEDNLLSPGLIGFGLASVVLVWLFAGGFFTWSILHVKDPVVSLAQIEYLGLICLGAMISSSSIIGLSFQTSYGNDTNPASYGCQAVPFLYSIGWVLQYASLSAKTYRLSRVVNNASHHRVTLPRTSGVWILLCSLTVDLVVVTAWTTISPLEYIREVESEARIDGLIVIESSGQCRMSSDISIWAFVGPILANHLVLMLGTHYLLDRVRAVNQRYQEKRYIGMASVLMAEVALIGVPVLVAAGDSVESVYVILSSLATVDSLGVLCLIFIPKMHYQRKGLEHGIGIGESVLTETHEKAKLREKNRSSDLGISRDLCPVLSSMDDHIVSSDFDKTPTFYDQEHEKAVSEKSTPPPNGSGVQVPEQSKHTSSTESNENVAPGA